jgi:hypothetical protein
VSHHRWGCSFQVYYASSIGTSGGAFLLSATDHYSSQEYKRAPDAYLDSGDHKAHVEVAVAD